MNIKHAFTTSHLTSKDAQDNALLRLPFHSLFFSLFPFPFPFLRAVVFVFACAFLIKAWIMLNSWFLSSRLTVLYSTCIRIDIYMYIYVKSIATRWPPDVPIVKCTTTKRLSVSVYEKEIVILIPKHDFNLIFNFYSLKTKFSPSQLVNLQT